MTRMSFSLVALARVFKGVRAPALLLATIACLGVSPPAAAQLDVGRLEINGPVWSGWEDLQQGTCTQAEQSAGACFISNSAPDCVSTGDNRIDCFTRVGGAVVARRQSDGQTWQPWRPLPGMAAHHFYNAAPECVAWGRGASIASHAGMAMRCRTSSRSPAERARRPGKIAAACSILIRNA